MRIHWIELENWRQHSKKRIEFDSRATVIFGPNETGKSTVLEALSRAFFDKSSSSAESIRRIKPLTATGNVASKVVVEFSIAEKRYRVEKKFNLQSGTSLSEIRDSTAVTIAQDNSADEHLIALLEAEMPSPRGSKPSQWGAFQWLWTPQEQRQLPTNAEGDPTTCLHLKGQAETPLLVTGRFQAVIEMVEASYSEYFTSTGRQKSASQISRDEEDLQKNLETARHLKDKIQKVEADKQRLQEISRELPTIDNKRRVANQSLEQARQETIELSSVKAELTVAGAGAEAAKRKVDEAEQAIKELNAQSDTIKNLEKKYRDTISRLAGGQALCHQLEERLQDLKDEFGAKTLQADKSEELLRDARILWTQADITAKIDALKDKSVKIGELDSQISGLKEKELSAAPTDTEVQKTIGDHSRIETLRKHLKARGLSVSITPGGSGTLDVEIDGEKLQTGILDATSTGKVTVSAGGLGKVTVQAELRQAEDAKADLNALEESVSGILEKYNVGSEEELKELNRTQNDISSRIRLLQAERRGIDQRALGEITGELEALRKRHKENERLERDPNAIKLNPLKTDNEKLVQLREEESKKARTDLDNARKERDSSEQKLAEAREKLSATKIDKDHTERELIKAKDKQQELIDRLGSVKNQQNILTEAKEEWQEKEKEYKTMDSRYKDMEKGPAEKIKRLQQESANLEKIYTEQKSTIDQLKGGISIASAEGAHTELAELESSLEIIEERLEKSKIRAESCMLLHKILKEEYQSALHEVVSPIKDRVTSSLSYITGQADSGVVLNEWLSPVKLERQSRHEAAMELQDASSGLKETIYLCVRLAVAQHLASKDSQCLVLDDPFVHVSSNRINRMIELINRATETDRLQVIILTHRPTELSGFSGKILDIQRA